MYSSKFYHHTVGCVCTSLEIFTHVKQRKAEFASTINKPLNSTDCSENQDPILQHSSSSTHLLTLYAPVIPGTLIW